MKAYVMVTGTVFGLLALVHVWRFVEEGRGVVDPFFVIVTALAAVLSIWAARLVFARSKG